MALLKENINNLIADDLDKRNQNWDSIDNTFELKADKTYVDSQDELKADKTEVDASLELKADKTYVDSQGALKADKVEVDASLELKADKTYVDDSLESKADKTYVDSQGALKADIAYVNELAFGEEVTIDLSYKADKTYVDSQDELKADKTELTNHINNQSNPHNVTQAQVGLSNVDNVKQMPISGGVLENYREKLVTLSGTSTTIDLSLGNVFTHTLTGNTTYSITNAVSGQAHSFTLIINMGSTVRTLTFPSSVKWQGGEIPDLTTASKTYVLTFMTIDGGTTWLGMFGGEF